MAVPVSLLARAAVGAAARRAAAEHAGTREEKRQARRVGKELLEDSPINTSGPVETAVGDSLF